MAIEKVKNKEFVIPAFVIAGIGFLGFLLRMIELSKTSISADELGDLNCQASMRP